MFKGGGGGGGGGVIAEKYGICRDGIISKKFHLLSVHK